MGGSCLRWLVPCVELRRVCLEGWSDQASSDQASVTVASWSRTGRREGKSSERPTRWAVEESTHTIQVMGLEVVALRMI